MFTKFQTTFAQGGKEGGEYDYEKQGGNLLRLLSQLRPRIRPLYCLTETFALTVGCVLCKGLSIVSSIIPASDPPSSMEEIQYIWKKTSRIQKPQENYC
jgi:hypothetical protein